ncbi:hypothetical protein [Kitasatospora sp. GP82]|uniref:hypothetical protein n=1 Tax=Kitasatospora sp. GP82 TaxID=3035089 RepID=UPI002475FB75|nr:hypothetical protein [Kitasatospora sp. GP82]MDH6128670.1 hypothetical protein [Kitasatospora sp. GP82]
MNVPFHVWHSGGAGKPDVRDRTLRQIQFLAKVMRPPIATSNPQTFRKARRQPALMRALVPADRQEQAEKCTGRS